MNTPTAQELFKAVKYGQKKNARICEFLSGMLGYTYPALQDSLVKVHQDKNKSTREKLCQSIVTLPHELKGQDFVKVGLMSLFLVEEYRFNKVLINITDKYRQFLGTCNEYRVPVKDFSASWIYQDFPSILRRSRSSWCLPATDLCDLILSRYNIQSVESKYRLVIAARRELVKLDAQVQEYLSESSINSWRELIHTWGELTETLGAESLLLAYKGKHQAPQAIHHSDDEPSASNLSVCKMEMAAEPKNQSSNHGPEPEYSHEAGFQEVDALIVGQNQHPGDFPSDAQATPPHGEAHLEDVAKVTGQTGDFPSDAQATPPHGVAHLEDVAKVTGQTGDFPSDAQATPPHGVAHLEDVAKVTGQTGDFPSDAQATSPHGVAHLEDVAKVTGQTDPDHAYTGKFSQNGHENNILPTKTAELIDDEAADAEVDMILSGGHDSHNNLNTDLEMFSQGDQLGISGQVQKLEVHLSPDHANTPVEQYNSSVDETNCSFDNPDTDAEECSWKGPMETLQREWFRMNASLTTEDEDEMVRQENQRKYYWGDTLEENDAHVQKMHVASAIDHHTCCAEASPSYVPTHMDWASIEHHTSRAKASPADVPTYMDGASGLCMQYQGPAQFTSEPPVHSSVMRVPARHVVDSPAPHSSTQIRNCLPPKHRLRYHPYTAGSAFRKVASRHSPDQH